MPTLSEWNLLDQAPEGGAEDNPGPEDRQTAGGALPALPVGALPPALGLHLPSEREVGPGGEDVQEKGGLLSLYSQHHHHLQAEGLARKLQRCRQDLLSFYLPRHQLLPWLPRQEEPDGHNSLREYRGVGLEEGK